MSLVQAVRKVLLRRDIREATEQHYLRVVNVFVSWAGSDDLAEFTPDAVSELLRDKSREGRIAYYVRSLRSVYRLLLTQLGMAEPIRSVRLPRLERIGWTADELARLFRVARERSAWWGSLVESAYYTGLSLCDLLSLRGDQVDEAGWVRTRRRKTGAKVLVCVPLKLAGELRQVGAAPIWPWVKTLEWFRRQFREILRGAGLSGSFKLLRACSGSAVDAEYPGAGHKHLANSPAIFEKHYRIDAGAKPTMPPRVG